MHRTLFIDIDGTLITEPTADQRGDTLREHALLAYMRDFAVHRHGISAVHATTVIDNLFDTRTWWDWHDYLTRLELHAPTFWDYADRRAAATLQPLEANLDLKLERLSLAGCRLCITSNNPTSGIRHKLRLAGLSRAWQKRHIDRIFGTDVLRAMKWDRTFWEQAVELADTPVSGITVVGNDWNDDVLSPITAGLSHFVMLDGIGPHHSSAPADAEVVHAADWSAAVQSLIEPTREAETPPCDILETGELRR